MNGTIDISKIPIRDPHKALEFCQGLFAFLSKDDPQAQAGPDISVVIPVYNEQENLDVLYRRLTATFAEHSTDYEIIFVDDGSSDESVPILTEIANHDRRVSVVVLSRNFGHQIAISAGMEFATGDAVIVMDADLQDPPEVLPDFIAKWRQGFDVVYAVRNHRKESRLLRLAYALFYRILHGIANIDIPLDAGDFCIMDRRVVDELKRMPERNRFVRGIRSWIGLKQTGLLYERSARYAGKPKYTFSRLVYLALDGLISFSYIPLRAITLLGFSVSGISIAMALVYIVQRLTVGLNPRGFATTVVAILFLAGIQLITIGVMGEYIGRIFEEVKQRPLFIVHRVIKKGADIAVQQKETNI